MNCYKIPNHVTNRYFIIFSVTCLYKIKHMLKLIYCTLNPLITQQLDKLLHCIFVCCLYQTSVQYGAISYWQRRSERQDSARYWICRSVYSQLTAEILGNDIHHSGIPSPSVRRSQPEHARRSRHTDWILRKLTIQCIIIDNNKHLAGPSSRAV